MCIRDSVDTEDQEHFPLVTGEIKSIEDDFGKESRDENRANNEWCVDNESANVKMTQEGQPNDAVSEGNNDSNLFCLPEGESHTVWTPGNPLNNKKSPKQPAIDKSKPAQFQMPSSRDSQPLPLSSLQLQQTSLNQTSAAQPDSTDEPPIYIRERTM